MRRTPQRIASRLSLETYHRAVRELRAEAPSAPLTDDFAEQLVAVEDERREESDPVAYAEMALLAEDAKEVFPTDMVIAVLAMFAQMERTTC